MSQEMSGNKLIAKNATMLYVRMFFTLAISFYSSRIVLKALGVSDYGIYNVVGGVIVMINVLTGSLGNATSRFLTYSLGKDTPIVLQTAFSTAYYIHLILAIVFLLIAETLGLWFVNTQLFIPLDRMVAANWVFQSAVVSTALSITQVPYDASINSHEKMGTFAYLQILNAVLKLGIAFVVLITTIIDHLILYSVLYVVLSIAFLLYYRYYCKKNFEECTLLLTFKKKLFKQMMAFSFWSMFGSVTNTFMQQGLNVLLNRFFGTLLNAAAGIAGQVQGILSAFTGNITIAFRPQIIKEYAVGNYSRFNYLIQVGTKFMVIVSLLSIVPVYFNLDLLMNLWLDNVPKGAVEICQVLLLTNIFNGFNPFLSFGISATGHIKKLNIILGIMYIAFIGIFYLVLRFTDSYILTYAINLLLSPISTIVYLFVLKKNLEEFEVYKFVFSSILPIMALCLSTGIVAWGIALCPVDAWVKLFITLFVCTIYTCLVSYKYILDITTKTVCKNYILKKLHMQK